MDANAIIAIIGGAIVAFVIRVFNVVVEWLSRVLGVTPPDPIPSDRTDRPSTGTTGANPGTVVDHAGPSVPESASDATRPPGNR